LPIAHLPNDIDIMYETLGDPAGEPILLIMGLGMQLISWPDSFCDGLVKQGFYLIRFDNRDSGLSTKLTHLGKPNTTLALLKMALRIPLKSGYSLYDMAADAVGVLDALQIKKAHILGVSMGGMIAQIVAARYPERSISLTSIMSTSSRRGLPEGTKEARKILFTPPPDGSDPERVIDHLLNTMHVIGSRQEYLAPDAVLRERIAKTVARGLAPLGTLRQLLAVGASGDRVELLKTIRVPSLVIHGKMDPLMPLACGRETAQLIPYAELREIDGMGHDLADGLNPYLTELIAEHCHAASQLNIPLPVALDA
jgi:proline iminopeptidase